jgi:ankyrin repeat protein
MATRGAAARELHLERLLRVGTCLAQCGFGAQVGQLAACARAFRADAQLWGAHARHRGPTGCTALMYAASVDDIPRIIFLLHHGADVEAVDAEGVGAEYGTTALMFACEAGHCEAARLLVERGGANVNAARTTDGMTALMFASQNGHLEIARFLVERGGANVHAARTTDGYTALMWASQKGHLEIVRVLVERGGACARLQDSNGGAPLTVASEFGHLMVVLYLLQHGAVVNAVRAACGRTALMLASWKGHLAVVHLLLEHGALKHLVNHAGNTARDLAASHPLVLAALA